MNGRVYDPKLGRFMSADPHIQAPTDTQSLNRYSYVLNNPLSATDPSGYFFKKLKKFVKKWGRAIIAITASVLTYGAASAWAVGLYGANCAVMCSLATASVIGGAAGGAAAGFVAGAITTGTLKGAVKGAFTGGVTGGLARLGSNSSIARGLSGGINGALETGSVKGFARGYLGGQLSG